MEKNNFLAVNTNIVGASLMLQRLEFFRGRVRSTKTLLLFLKTILIINWRKPNEG
jgi:hypothetical protein